MVWRASAAELAPEQVEFFESKVRPILVEHCYKCHSAESGKSKGGLELDSRDAVLKGGGTGPALIAGNPDKSLLIDAVRYKNEDLQMPPDEAGGKLPAEKIAVLEQWVKLGAPDPRVGETKAAALDMAKAAQHWAFQAPVKSSAPAVKNAKWVATPVDAFLLAKLEAKKLAPSAAADKRTLIRRVTYDLTGLPPTPEEVEAFVADRDPQAYAKVVERLLASPRYGERWGRFWLDVARYADTKGYLAGNVERRYPFSHTYRDYVIRAFNDDKPYDRFIVEQLAADQLPLGEDKSALAAMGFLTLGRRFLNNQNDIIDDRIDVVTRGLMGLTVTCARCHDHKFDPIPTKDYYSLHGVFASSDEPNEKPLLGPLVESAEYEQFLKKKAELEVKIKAREADEVKKFLATAREKTGDYLLAAHDADHRPKEEKFDLFAGNRKLNVEVLRRWQALLTERAKGDDPVLAPWFALAALPAEGFAEKAKELIEGWVGARTSGPQSEESGRDARAPEAIHAALAAKPPASLKDAAAIYTEVFTKIAKLDEAALTAEQRPIRELLFAANAPPNLGYESVAEMLRREINNKTAGLKREIEALNWTEPGAPLRAMALSDRNNPRNSRVMKRGNPANLGPEVPRQFLEVIAGPQRQPFEHGSGRLDLATEIVDPKNPLTARVLVNRVWGWHFGAPLVATPSDFGVRTAAPVQRELLDWLAASFVESGWSVKQLQRWIVLSSAYRQSSDENPKATAVDPDNQLVHRFSRHRLEFEAMRDTVLAVSGALDLRSGGIPDDIIKEPFTVRRTIYGYVDRQNLPGMFRTFDYPNPDVSSAQRLATTVPQQALFMMNSPFVLEQARGVARRIDAGGDARAPRDEADQITALYRVLYQRAPTSDERKLAQAFLRRPVVANESLPPIPAGWQYGYGRYDAGAGRVRDFQPMAARKDGRMSPSETYPDPAYGHLSVTATGGHAGRDEQHASIRRWISPGNGRVKIEGTLAHASANGDGVRGRIFSSEGGHYGAWTVHNNKVDTTVELGVQGGELIDFVVDCIGNGNSDAYTWAPNLTFTPGPDSAEMAVRTWNAKKDFETATKPVAPLTRLEELAQVLLLSNELAFVD